MNNLEILREQLNYLVDNEKPYKEILKKSKELDYYITEEMIKIHTKNTNENYSVTS